MHNTDTDKKNLTETPKGPDSIETCSTKALQRIAGLNLKPLPYVYELWFRYFQGDPEIIRSVDTYQGDIDESACHKIYKRHLSEAPRDEAVRKISEQVHQAINDLALTVNSIKTATSGYGESLSSVPKQMESAKTIEELGQIVSGIVLDTKKMVQKNQDLEFQLSSSSTQVAELKKNLDNVRKEAMTDGLTGLANRKAFDQKIRDWVEELSTSEGTLCLLMLDIDYFKKFNDSYGHQTGDQVLRLVARTLTDGVRGRDMASRFGGEEFAILLPDTPLLSAVKVAETLRKSVESKEVINRSNNENLGRITLSVGVSQYVPGESIADFIERADGALYEAKKTGRNRVKAASDTTK